MKVITNIELCERIEAKLDRLIELAEKLNSPFGHNLPPVMFQISSDYLEDLKRHTKEK